MRKTLVISCASLALCATAARAQHYQFAPAYVDPDAAQSAEDWVQGMWPLLSPWERAQCPETQDAQAEQACILAAFEREAGGGVPAAAGVSPAAPVPAPPPEPVLPSYDVVEGCLHRPGITASMISQCVDAERRAGRYLRHAFRHMSRDQQLRCVGTVGDAQRAGLQSMAAYYQALTVYCGKALAKASH